MEPKFHNDKNMPKLNQQARMDQFLGFSDEHSYFVANVNNLSTGYISPQIHLVFYDFFETVIRTKYYDNVLTMFVMICLT